MPEERNVNGSPVGSSLASASVVVAASSIGVRGASSSRNSGADGPIRFAASRPPSAEVGGQHDRSLQEGDHGRVVGHRLGAQGHGQAQLDHVPVAPLALERDVAPWLAGRRLRLAVDAHAKARGPPRRATARGARGATGASSESSRRALSSLGEARALAQAKPLLAPGDLGRQVQVHVESVRPAGVDRFAEARRVLHPGPDAAPERVLRRRVRAPGPGLHRHVVGHEAGGRVVRGEDVVEEAALVELDARRAGRRAGTGRARA